MDALWSSATTTVNSARSTPQIAHHRRAPRRRQTTSPLPTAPHRSHHRYISPNLQIRRSPSISEENAVASLFHFASFSDSDLWLKERDESFEFPLLLFSVEPKRDMNRSSFFLPMFWCLVGDVMQPWLLCCFKKWGRSLVVSVKKNLLSSFKN